MIKGLSLKRNLQLDAMYSGHGTPCKRAKLNSRHTRHSSSQSASQRHSHSRTTERCTPQPSTSSPFGNLSNELTPEKMVTNIKLEADRLSRKRHQGVSADQTTAGVSGAVGGPGDQIVATSTTNDFHANDGQKPMFTLTEVSHMCRRMMDDQKQRIREEYEKTLKDKLAEQYDTFIRFDHDQLQKKIASQDRPSYLS